MTPKDLGMEFERFRPLQLETACRIATSKAKFILLQAPPGSGKSLLALTAARIKERVGRPSRTVITVSTRQLQDQYEATLRIPSIKGQSNYPCAVSVPGISCDLGPCHVGKGCTKEEKYSTCYYYAAKAKAASAPECVLNLAYFLREANYIGQFSHVGFLVLDEAHLLENALSQFIGLSFSLSQLSQLSLPYPRKATFTAVLNWIDECEPLVREMMTKNEELVLSLLESPGAEIVRRQRTLEELSQRLSWARLACEEPDNWVIYEDKSGRGSIEIKPIKVGDVARRSLWRHIEPGGSALLMSATILDGDDLARTLGIREEEKEWIDLPASFPADNRPVNYYPVAKVRGGSKLDENIEKIVLAVDAILELFPDDKGVIHSVSNELTRKIVQKSRNQKRLIHHLDRPREEIIGKFLASKKPLVLVSPSVTIGLDLPDDAGRFQIIAKLQFPDMGDPIVQARMQLSQSWYAAQTARSLVQSTGRVVRHEHDQGVNFILDSNCNWFLRQNEYMFPQWWKDSFHTIDSLEQAVVPDFQKKGDNHAASRKSLAIR